ncbi:MAG: hypothetical protein ABF301_00455 [Sulfurovum sp.]
MKKTILTLASGLLLSTSVYAADMAKGLNVILTTKDTQTQMMAMVLAMNTMKLKKEVNIVLCSNAGDLADKNISSQNMKPINKSPKMLLQGLIKKGASVKVCPLYLPNASKDKSILIDGVSVAKPNEVATKLMEKGYKILSY